MQGTRLQQWGKRRSSHLNLTSAALGLFVMLLCLYMRHTRSQVSFVWRRSAFLPVPEDGAAWGGEYMGGQRAAIETSHVVVLLCARDDPESFCDVGFEALGPPHHEWHLGLGRRWNWVRSTPPS